MYMCWDCNRLDLDPHKEFIRGRVDPDFGEVEVNYKPRKKIKTPPDRKRTRPGCPANDNKAHVYVWTTEGMERDFFSDYYGFHKTERRLCCGCGKRNGSRLSEEYMKVKERKWAKLATPEKGVPIPRWNYRGRPRRVYFKYWTWENDDPDYTAARKEYREKHGWDEYFYGSSLYF
jgi:hypothetical protein